jgi:hypothetical protein
MDMALYVLFSAVQVVHQCVQSLRKLKDGHKALQSLSFQGLRLAVCPHLPVLCYFWRLSGLEVWPMYH